MTWCVPQMITAQEAPAASVAPPAPAATESAEEAKESLADKIAPAEEAPLQVALREHLNAPQSGPCGRPDCPVCNPPKPKPPAPILPWKPLYFDNDFSYKGKPNAPHFLGEELKNMPLFDGCCEPSGLTLSFGGEIRHRFMNEDNRLRPGGPAQTDYNLWRWRNYLDLKYRDEVRAYIEMIDASIFGIDAPATITGIDKNRWDIQNAFIDLKVLERDDKPVYFRVGRQELLFGVPAPNAYSPGQQILSPLDWANTRRNFEGFRLLSKGDVWDIDLFAVRPVNTATPTGPGGGRPAAGPTAAVFKYDNKADEADFSRWFSGVYTVYKGLKDNTFEPYYVWLDTKTAKQVGTWADGDRHTLGLRWTTNKSINDECNQTWLVLGGDTEGAYQFGKDNGANVQAGFFTTKWGATLSQVTWTPGLSLLYYWGSGDNSPADGTNSTYDVLWPLNHAYWGIIDNLSGQNLQDIALQATIKPHKKVTGLAAMHWFDRANSGDTAYNVAGAPVVSRAVAAGQGSDNLGQELDLIATYAYNPNFDIQAGYSWFWYGGFFNGLAVAPGDATQFYVQTSLRY